MLFLHIRCATVRVEKWRLASVYFFISCTTNFGKITQIFRKAKSLGIILTPLAVFVSISTFLLFLVFEVACGE